MVGLRGGLFMALGLSLGLAVSSCRDDYSCGERNLPGTEGCPCLSGDRCVAELVCAGGLCRSEQPGAGTGATTATGSDTGTATGTGTAGTATGAGTAGTATGTGTAGTGGTNSTSTGGSDTGTGG